MQFTLVHFRRSTIFSFIDYLLSFLFKSITSNYLFVLELFIINVKKLSPET